MIPTYFGNRRGTARHVEGKPVRGSTSFAESVGATEEAHQYTRGVDMEGDTLPADN